MTAANSPAANTPDQGMASLAPPADREASGKRRQPGGRKRRRPARRPFRFSLSNWPVSWRLGTVLILASVTGLFFGGLRAWGAVTTSAAYGRTAQVAVLGEQATRLAQALGDERDLSAGCASYQTLAADATADHAGPGVVKQVNAARASVNADLTAAKKITDAYAKRVRSLAIDIGPAFPASLQAKAQAVVTMIDSLPGVRSQAVNQAPSQIIPSYSVSISSLFILNDEITSGSGDTPLADEVRALGALSRAQDQASQQRAILYSTLIEASVDDAGGGAHAPSNNIGTQSLADAGGVTALTTSQGLEFADLTDFNDAATQAQSNAFGATEVSGPANEAQLIEGFVSLTGDPRLTFEKIGNATSLHYPRATVATTWYSDMTAVLSQMRSIEAQVMDSIVTRSQSLEHGALESAVLTGTVSIGAVLLVILVTALIGRSLISPLRRLQGDALEIAAVRLPARVAAAAAGADDSGGPPVVEPISVQSTDEIGRVARAFDQVHAEAVRLAGNEAQLRGSLNAMFISLSRRSVPLIDRLARTIDAMEQQEDDPEQLAKLFAMDHLVTRMRRNSENLLVLAGEEPVRKWTGSVPLTDVARAAVSEIEQYGRVALAVQPGIVVSGQAAADVVHLLAELIENATLFSPRTAQVRVTVMELSAGGVLVEVRDDGVGISASRLADMNWRLEHPPVVDVSISRHMGLYAVSRLAARHGIRVRLRPGRPQGLSALVWLPGTLAMRVQADGPEGRTQPFGFEAVGPLESARSVPDGNTASHHRADAAAGGPQLPPPGRPPRSTRSSSAWFAAKRPSSGAPAPAAEPAARWQRTGDEATTGGGVPDQIGRTASGLPRRMPRTNAYPGSDMPDSGMPAVPAGASALSAPPAEMPARPPHRENANQDPRPPRRHSPEAARSRLSGFQLGNRDAEQPGHATRRAPDAGEENSR